MQYINAHKIRRYQNARKDKLLGWCSEHLEELREFHDAISKNIEEEILKKVANKAKQE